MKHEAEPAIIRPFFVYGTLRPGCHNDRLWHGVATAHHDGNCTVVGWALVTQGHFPYMVRATMSQTTGCLIMPDDGRHAEVRRRFDALEGVPHHYERIVVPVICPGAVVRAWTYVPANPDHVIGLADVPTNEAGFFDWREQRLRAVR